MEFFLSDKIGRVDQSNGFKRDEDFKASERARLINPLYKINFNFSDLWGMFTTAASLMGAWLSL
jgi:hypothetical protein